MPGSLEKWVSLGSRRCVCAHRSGSSSCRIIEISRRTGCPIHDSEPRLRLRTAAKTALLPSCFASCQPLLAHKALPTTGQLLSLLRYEVHLRQRRRKLSDITSLKVLPAAISKLETYTSFIVMEQRSLKK